MGSASNLSRRFFAVDATYKQVVFFVADLMRDGKFNRSMLMDAVLLADELHTERQYTAAFNKLPEPREEVRHQPA